MSRICAFRRYLNPWKHKKLPGPFHCEGCTLTMCGQKSDFKRSVWVFVCVASCWQAESRIIQGRNADFRSKDKKRQTKTWARSRTRMILQCSFVSVSRLWLWWVLGWWWGKKWQLTLLVVAVFHCCTSTGRSVWREQRQTANCKATICDYVKTWEFDFELITACPGFQRPSSLQNILRWKRLWRRSRGFSTPQQPKQVSILGSEEAVNIHFPGKDCKHLLSSSLFQHSTV